MITSQRLPFDIKRSNLYGLKLAQETISSPLSPLNPAGLFDGWGACYNIVLQSHEPAGLSNTTFLFFVFKEKGGALGKDMAIGFLPVTGQGQLYTVLIKWFDKSVQPGLSGFNLFFVLVEDGFQCSSKWLRDMYRSMRTDGAAQMVCWRQVPLYTPVLGTLPQIYLSFPHCIQAADAALFLAWNISMSFDPMSVLPQTCVFISQMLWALRSTADLPSWNSCLVFSIWPLELTEYVCSDEQNSDEVSSSWH